MVQTFLANLGQIFTDSFIGRNQAISRLRGMRSKVKVTAGSNDVIKQMPNFQSFIPNSAISTQVSFTHTQVRVEDFTQRIKQNNKGSHQPLMFELG